MNKRTIRVAMWFCVSLLFLSCNIAQIDLTSKGQATVDSWTVSSDRGVPTITKTLSGQAYDVTVTFTGEQASLNDILDGNWNIQVGLPGQDPLVFSEKNNNVRVLTKDVKGATFTVSVNPRPSRNIAIGGSLATGTWMTMDRDGVWWGMNAWTQPASGNVDLYLYRVVNGSWAQTATSQVKDQGMDTVSDNPGWWWYHFMLKIYCVDTSVFTGSVSW